MYKIPCMFNVTSYLTLAFFRLSREIERNGCGSQISAFLLKEVKQCLLVTVVTSVVSRQINILLVIS